MMLDILVVVVGLLVTWLGIIGIIYGAILVANRVGNWLEGTDSDGRTYYH